MSEARDVEVVELRADQEAACGVLLARAFFDDPIFAWVEPEEEARRRLLDAMFLALTKRSRRLAVALTTGPEMLGASLWRGPELRHLSPAQLAMTGLDRLGDFATPAAMERLDAAFDPVEAALEEDSPEPFWYLGVLGVAAEQQGRGIGSRLMQPILERADGAGLPVALETAKPRNLPLYRRYGFEVSRELPPPEPGGPTIWTMKRSPR